MADAHFIVYCRCYPEFSFIVPELRKLRRKRALEELGQEAARQVAATVGFHLGKLDSKEAGLDEEEAACVLAALQRRTARPAWGTDIFTQGQRPTGRVVDGGHVCPVCQQHFDSATAMLQHGQEHVPTPEPKPQPQRKAA